MFFLIVLACLVVLVVVEAILTEVEHWGWASITLVGTLVGLHFLHVFSVVDFVKDYTVEAIIGAALYVVAGVVWSFIKWFSFLMGFRDAYRAEKEKFFEFKNLPVKSELTAELQEEFLKGLSGEGRYGGYRHIEDERGNRLTPTNPRWWSDVQSYKGNSLNVKPKAAKNKARITSWGCFWPFSMLGTLINDPIRRLWNFLWSQLKALYQRMADKLFASHPELK